MTQVVDTAEVEAPEAEAPDTAVEPNLDQPAEAELPEPETSVDETPETPEPTEPETEEPKPLVLDDLDDDSLKTNERVAALIEAEAKSRTAREVESVRRKTEAEAQQRVADAERAQSNQFIQQGMWQQAQSILEKAVAESPDGKLTAETQQSLVNMVQQATRAAVLASEGAGAQILHGLASSEMPDGFEIPKDILAEYEHARGARDERGQVVALAKIQRAQGHAEGYAQGLKDAEKSAKKEVETANQAIEEERAKKDREATPGRTGTAGDAASERSLDDIIDDPSVSWEDKKKAYKAKTGREYSPF